MVEIQLNGESRNIPEGQTVTELIETLGIGLDRVAVELDRGILRKADWSTTRLLGGEEVEVVHFVGGG